MGFEVGAATEALRRVGDVVEAVQLLLNTAPAPAARASTGSRASTAPASTRSRAAASNQHASPSSALPEDIRALLEMGFDEAQARAALDQARGDRAEAINLLLRGGLGAGAHGAHSHPQHVAHSHPQTAVPSALDLALPPVVPPEAHPSPPPFAAAVAMPARRAPPPFDVAARYPTTR